MPVSLEGCCSIQTELKMPKGKAKIGLEPILKDLQSNTLAKLCYIALI